jgi:hypothetical protein
LRGRTSVSAVSFRPKKFVQREPADGADDVWPAADGFPFPAPPALLAVVLPAVVLLAVVTTPSL